MKLRTLFGTLVVLSLLSGCSQQMENEVPKDVLPDGPGDVKELPPGAAPGDKELPPDKAPEEVLENTIKTGEGALDGPYWQNLVFSHSSDGENWSESTTVVEHASGPDGIVLSKDIGAYNEGDVLVVFSHFTENKIGSEVLGFVHSGDNGETWSSIEIAALEGASHIVIDPAIYQLEDGSLLLIYQDLSESNDKSDEHHFYLASSTDGKIFKFEGEIFEAEEFFIHPDLVFFNDEWFLFYSADWGDRKIWFSKSDEYSQFEVGEELDFEGMPGVMVVDGELELYGCDKQDGITFITSSDGEAYSAASVTGVRGCAPVPFVMGNGDRGLIMTYSTK